MPRFLLLIAGLIAGLVALGAARGFELSGPETPFLDQLDAPASPLVAQSITLDRSTLDQLGRATPGQRLKLPALALGLSKREPMEFKRIELYAGHARVWVHDGTSRQPLARSPRLFFTAAGANGGAGFSFDPQTGAIEGLLVDGRQSYQLTSQMQKNGSTRVDLHSLREARANAGFACGNDNTHQPQYRMDSASAGMPQNFGQGSLNAMHKGAGLLYQAVVAVDTDNEFLFNKFANDADSARNWIEDLFVSMNAFYEADLAMRMLLGDIILRIDSTPATPDFNTDPENFNDGLAQFRDYFNGNQGSLDRDFAALLSGKDINSNSFSGVAYVGAYCSGFSYSHNRIGSASFISPAFIAGGLGHELGHNLGSRHTHCEALAGGGAFVDECYSNERSGCYVGATSCPTGTDGSLMSYCHAGAAGFDGSGPGEGTASNCSVSDYFHPLIIGKLSGLLAANNPSCIADFAESGQIFTNGFEN